MSNNPYIETPVETKQGEPMFLFCVYNIAGASAFSCCTLQRGKRTEYESCAVDRGDTEEMAKQALHYANYRTGCEIQNGFPGDITRSSLNTGERRRRISPEKFNALQSELREVIDSGLVTVATS